MRESGILCLGEKKIKRVTVHCRIQLHNHPHIEPVAYLTHVGLLRNR